MLIIFIKYSMPTKDEYTIEFLKAGDIDIENTTIQEAKIDWWQNIRDGGGLRLTELGSTYLITHLNLHSYDIQIPRNVTLTMANILILDNYIRCPYYLNLQKNIIVIFCEHQASELMIYGNDLAQFFNNYKITS